MGMESHGSGSMSPMACGGLSQVHVNNMTIVFYIPPADPAVRLVLWTVRNSGSSCPCLR